MQLYIKQKVFSLKDRFTVFDENETPRYYVEGKFFSIGKKLTVTDEYGQEAAYIQQKVLTFKPRFFVYVNGEQVAEIVKEITFFKPRYTIEGLGWEVRGDFMNHNYEIMGLNSEPIAAIYKKWLSWGDTYCITCEDDRNDVMVLAVVLAIDCVNAQQAQASSSSSSNNN